MLKNIWSIMSKNIWPIMPKNISVMLSKIIWTMIPKKYFHDSFLYKSWKTSQYVFCTLLLLLTGNSQIPSYVIVIIANYHKHRFNITHLGIVSCFDLLLLKTELEDWKQRCHSVIVQIHQHKFYTK